MNRVSYLDIYSIVPTNNNKIRWLNCVNINVDNIGIKISYTIKSIHIIVKDSKTDIYLFIINRMILWKRCRSDNNAADTGTRPGSTEYNSTTNS